MTSLVINPFAVSAWVGAPEAPDAPTFDSITNAVWPSTLGFTVKTPLTKPAGCVTWDLYWGIGNATAPDEFEADVGLFETRGTNTSTGTTLYFKMRAWNAAHTLYTDSAVLTVPFTLVANPSFGTIDGWGMEVLMPSSFPPGFPAGSKFKLRSTYTGPLTDWYEWDGGAELDPDEVVLFNLGPMGEAPGGLGGSQCVVRAVPHDPAYFWLQSGGDWRTFVNAPDTSPVSPPTGGYIVDEGGDTYSSHAYAPDDDFQSADAVAFRGYTGSGDPPNDAKQVIQRTEEFWSGAEFGPDSPSYVAVTEWNIYGESDLGPDADNGPTPS